jgi:sulfane dehydrogenase subunit SoxC
VRGETKQPVTNPGAFTNQHYNSLTSWGVESNGSVKHVYA